LGQPNLVRRSLKGIDRQRQTLGVARDKADGSTAMFVEFAVLLAPAFCPPLRFDTKYYRRGRGVFLSG
jgi:hypothetical protein